MEGQAAVIFDNLLGELGDAYELAKSAVAALEEEVAKPPVTLTKVASAQLPDHRLARLVDLLVENRLVKRANRNSVLQGLRDDGPEAALDILEKLASSAIYPAHFLVEEEDGQVVEKRAGDYSDDDDADPDTRRWRKAIDESKAELKS